MTKQEQIEEMAQIINGSTELDTVAYYRCMNIAKTIYNAGYQKAEEVRKETAKEIFYRVVNICRKEIDFQDGTVNTQLEPLYFGIANGCAYIRGEVEKIAKEYGVEVEK